MTPNLIPLIGVRHVRISEPESWKPMAGGVIKELTGGEPVEVRQITEDFIPLSIQFPKVLKS
jgi:putative DNA primase/helicase